MLTKEEANKKLTEMALQLEILKGQCEDFADEHGLYFTLNTEGYSIYMSPKAAQEIQFIESSKRWETGLPYWAYQYGDYGWLSSYGSC